jgi:hypothetical protein
MDPLELARSVGQPIDFVAFERGIVLRPRGDQFITHASTRADGVVVSVDQIVSVYRPIMARFRPRGTSSTFDVMFHPEGGFAPKIPSFGMTAELMYDAHAVQYSAGALVHHVAGMVSAYEKVRDAFKDLRTIPGATTDRRAIFGSRPEPYYEFDALLGVVRRSYDSCRYLLWKCFGPTQGTLPRSFERALPHCERLDPAVRQRLERSWSAWGTRITAYRDCVHHYVPIDFGISSIFMEEPLAGVWGATARIPDNPEARSKHRFQFTGGLDALTVGWTAASEAICILRLVAATVEQRSNTAMEPTARS